MAETRELLEELMMDILLRLPMKSVVRFRCVSTSWCTLLSDPHFIFKNFLLCSNDDDDDVIDGIENNKNSSYMLLTYKDATTMKFMSAFLSQDTLDVCLTKDFPHRMYIVGSCNGLVCLCSFEVYTIWNTATDETKVVPEFQVIRPPSTRASTSNHGFGFDPKTNDYKIVRIVDLHLDIDGYNYADDRYREAQVYSLKNDSWKILDDAFFASVEGTPLWILTYSYGIETNGALYWVAIGEESHDTLVSFDISSEEFKHFQLPDFAILGCIEDGDCITLLSFNNTLAMVVADETQSQSEMGTWTCKKWGDIFGDRCWGIVYIQPNYTRI
ncbi:hypothetical protein Tsubulata_032237 [Turnera subulata]|uniref:F-box domain-containing protein n=1 Tax=Turnera subulata TaxID=218843 RepID=A0A9Q0JMQ5_9ROSI|nr:hypothetical protein Tsubulata_032237 [Turnera subulata]